MRFLVTSEPRHMVQPDMLPQLIDAMGPWRNKYARNFEQIWGVAGRQGGGCIMNVGSLEELDTIMSEFPMQAISQIEIIPLVDLDSALQRARQAVEEVAVGVS